MATVLRSSENYVWLDPIDKIGKGATSFVYKCRHKSSGELFAVKTFVQNTAHQQVREIEILMSLEHRNVMRLVSKEKEKNVTVIIMEYCAGGSVYDILDQPENACGFQDDELILFMTDTIAALKYLRERAIVHRDLKPGNILKYIDADGQTFYKLTDFGAARDKVRDDGEFSTITGTEEYLHPNMHEQHVKRNHNYVYARFGPSCDLWSLGVTIYHVASGKLPFRPFGGRTEHDKMLEITKGKKTGIISGVQLVPNGPVIYSDKLPNTCRLTNALRQLITPMLAGLMESNDSEMWKFERLYSFAEKLRAMRYVDLFVMPACTFDRVYFQAELFQSAHQPAAAAPVESRDAVSIHAQPVAMEPVGSTVAAPKCTRVIKQYISSQYIVDATECGLIIPTLTEQFSRGGAALLGGYGSQRVPGTMESVKVATDAELTRVTVSLEHTRVRVALSERAASKTWSASAVLSAAFANSDADVDVATAGFGLGASMKQYVVAMRQINVSQIADTNKYASECIAKLDSPNTMICDWKASVNQVLEQSDREETLSDTRSQTAFVYSTFLASAALSDAQMLHCATVNYFIVYVESIMNALRERANALNETSRQIRQTLQVFNAFITSQTELLKLCKREYALLDQVLARHAKGEVANLTDYLSDLPMEPAALESDAFPLRAPQSLREALEKLSSVPLQLEKLEKDCNARLKEVNSYVSKYYEVIVTKDELRKRWHSKVADKLCFGECLTASLAAGNSDANAKTDLNADKSETHTLPCWKRLQTYYEQCTTLHSALHTKYNAMKSFSKVADCDRRLLRNRAEVSQTHVSRHCWVRTQQCYSSFIDWLFLFEGATKRIESLRVHIEHNSSEQKDSLKKLADLCDEVKLVCEQFYADEKRNMSARSTANEAQSNLKKRSVQTAQTQTDHFPQADTQYNVSFFSTMNSRIDTILHEMDTMQEFLDTSDSDSVAEN